MLVANISAGTLWRDWTGRTYGGGAWIAVKQWW